jgi:hypothetical protein
MQTKGTPLLAVNRCSLARVRMASQDGCSAPGLLDLAAVRSMARFRPAQAKIIEDPTDSDDWTRA